MKNVDLVLHGWNHQPSPPCPAKPPNRTCGKNANINWPIIMQRKFHQLPCWCMDIRGHLWNIVFLSWMEEVNAQRQLLLHVWMNGCWDRWNRSRTAQGPQRPLTSCNGKKRFLLQKKRLWALLLPSLSLWSGMGSAAGCWFSCCSFSCATELRICPMPNRRNGGTGIWPRWRRLLRECRGAADEARRNPKGDDNKPTNRQSSDLGKVWSTRQLYTVLRWLQSAAGVVFPWWNLGPGSSIQHLWLKLGSWQQSFGLT